MFDNYFFLQRVTDELRRELHNYSFVEAFSQSRNELVIEFEKDSVGKYLIFSFSSLPPFIYCRDNYAKAKKNFAKHFVELEGHQLFQISIDQYERNIRLIFDSDQLVFIIRGNQSNCYLVSDDLIISSFKKKKEYENQKFSTVYSASSLDISIFEDEVKFNECIYSFINGKKNILHQIIGKEILAEIISREKWEKEVCYFNAFSAIINSFKSENLFKYDDGTFSVGKFISKGNNSHEYSDFFSSLRKIFYTKKDSVNKEKLKENILKNIGRQIERLEGKLTKLKSERNLEDKSDEYRLKGNLIISNINEIKRGSKKIDLENPQGELINIVLDPSKTIHENAELYFSNAKEEKKRLESVHELISSTEIELKQKRELFEKIYSTEDSYFLESMNKKLSTKNKVSDETQKMEAKFRHFVVAGSYDVFVGKDSKSNDLMTTKFAKANDLWFHVRGASGSHTILRKKEKAKDFPKESILAAASIAAYYSKVKHSKFVPVAYAEKKYVTKKKDLPSGTVYMTREKVVMVEPKLPEMKGEKT